MKLIEADLERSGYGREVVGVELSGRTEADLLLENLVIYMGVMRHIPASRYLNDAARDLCDVIERDQAFLTERDCDESFCMLKSSGAEAFVLETVVGACLQEESSNPMLLHIMKNGLRSIDSHTD